VALLELAPHLHAALGAGQTLVVPTAQRAAALRLGFATAQLAAGQRAFPTPDVHSLSGWLRAQPVRGAAGRILRHLGAGEEWLLWHEAVTGASAQLSLPNIAGLVDAVRRSAELLHDWRIAPALLRQAGTPESALLAASLIRIEARLLELSAVGDWQMLRELAVQPPRRVPLLAGFAMHTPARRALLAAWEQRGSASLELPCAFPEAPAASAHAADGAQELAMVAQWCRERLRAAPAARLLVIVPQLAQRQLEVRRVFAAALGSDQDAYALEGGQPLLAFAPVAAGLSTLQVLTSQVEFAVLSQWLRESFWPRPAAAPRAQLDVWLRGVVPPRLGVRQLLRALRAAPPSLLAYADELAAGIERMLEALAGGPRLALAEWCNRFGRVFALCELTARAARQRSSHTQQVLQRLDELLQECATLPATLGTFDCACALERFTQLLARTRFEPATGDAAVTLTASLADPIVRYDGIWASGLHSGAIPQAARFDPFIPAALQRQAHISAADASLLVNQARQALVTLCRCSREFIVSAPHQDADLELTVSPLLAPFAARRHAGSVCEAEEWPRAMRAARAVEHYVDEPGAAWPEGRPLPAGTRAIELQSRCPFRAYAQLRLGADPLETPVPGITARERGSMLHRALQLLWTRLGGSTELAAARAAQSLGRSISECVAQAASEVLHEVDADTAADATGLLELRRAAITRERGRAERLVRALCELEAGRAPFVIHELEAEHAVSIAGAVLNVRIDRMDRLQDGTHAILDYKTGRAMTPDWEVARTTYPQLLVYLLAAGVAVSALAVAHLDPKSVVFKGIGDQDSRLPGIKGLGEAGAWAQQRAAWADQVGQLAADFMRGEARVDPVDRACDYCHLQAFCRIADAP
jgi:ATP-dependent helicase/nuclease subunit B